MKHYITVSRPRSGLNFYLCTQAAEQLGGIGARVDFETTSLNDGSILCVLTKHERGTHTIHGSPPSQKDGLNPYRVVFSNKWLADQGIEIPEFGPQRCDWTTDDSQLTLTVPPTHMLSVPLSRKSHVGRENRQFQTPHAVLGEALRTINRLLEDNCKDVQIILENREGRRVLERPFKLFGKIIKEEILGS